MSAAPCQQSSQPQESQRGCLRFQNLADGKGMNTHFVQQKGAAPIEAASEWSQGLLIFPGSI